MSTILKRYRDVNKHYKVIHSINIGNEMKEFLLAVLERIGFAFWVEIKTEYPRCTYYFGPFLSKSEAEGARSGYLEDLQSEGAQGLKFEIKRCKPTNLTVFDDQEEVPSFLPVSVLRSQAF
jgi:hypothetical protein